MGEQLTDEQRIVKLHGMMRIHKKDAKIADGLLSACVNSIVQPNGTYELHTPKANAAFEAADSVYAHACEMAATVSDAEQKRVWMLLIKKSLLFLAHNSFDKFMLYVEFDRPPEKRFYAPRRKQLMKIVDGFQDCADGKLDLLTVSQPKRTGKSQIGVFFSLWRAGFSPDKAALLVGQGDSLVKSFYSGILEIAQDKETYNYWDVFPQCILTATNAEEHTIDFNLKKRFCTITCRSIDGKLTGATEASNFMYIDDPVSGYEEAQNYQRLDLLWNKIRGDVLGRRKEGVPIIAQGTRFSIKDPIGHLQEIAPMMKWRTRVIEVPALDPITDLSNFNYKYGLGFSTSYYRNERKMLSDAQWMSEFQQQPIETKGVVFPKDSLQYYYNLPDKEPDAILAVCDPALGGGDFTSMPICYLYGEDAYIEDVVFSTALPEFTTPACAQKCVKHNVSILQVESNNQGLFIADSIEKNVRALGGKTSIRKKPTTTNKQTKIIVESDYIKAHFWFKDIQTYANGSEYAAFMRNMWAYSQMAKNQHDDACLSGDTKIATLFGDKRIDQIKSGELVITPFGIRKVLHVGCTCASAEVITQFGITATPRHKVYNKITNMFSPFDSFTMNEEFAILSLKEMIAWQSKLLKQQLLTGKSMRSAGRTDIISCTQLATASAETQSSSTEPYGNITTEKSRMAFKFITLMAIRTITTFLIWSVYQFTTIFRCTQKRKWKKTQCTENCFKKTGLRRRGSGIKVQKGLSGIKNMPNVCQKLTVKHFITFAKNAARNFLVDFKQSFAAIRVCKNSNIGKKEESAHFLNANGAVRSSCRTPVETIENGFAANPAFTNTNCSNTEIGSNKIPVYNMTVEHAGCYYANGVLVSNCDSAAMLAQLLKSMTGNKVQAFVRPF